MNTPKLFPHQLRLLEALRARSTDPYDLEPGTGKPARDVGMSPAFSAPYGKTEPTPPFGSIRKAAMAVYVPPFRYQSGYVYDSQGHVVADDGGWADKETTVRGAVGARIRGWGRIGYMPNPAALQDEVGRMMADALNAYYAAKAEPAPASPSDEPDFVSRTNKEYAEWCATTFVPEALDERGMKSLDGLWAWQEQERRIVAMRKSGSPSPIPPQAMRDIEDRQRKIDGLTAALNLSEAGDAATK